MPEDIQKIRHSLAHLLAAAVMEKYPKAKLAIGPAIENGFYYDIELPRSFLPEALPELESRMRELILEHQRFIGKKVTKQIARKLFKDQPYKLEIIKELPGTIVGTYQNGAFLDLCKGGHVKNTAEIDPEAFRLAKVAGAYWRGDEKNKMLTRIYGLAFASKQELQDYLHMQEEAEKRDHKKLGPAMDLFVFSELVGPGLPLWTPKGTLVRNLLDQYVWELRSRIGYGQVEIPHITKKELYEVSGHWDKFKDELFKVQTREGHQFALKPMNCPHHTQIYARRQWSYRELPQRYANTTMCYRDEQSGELAGLSRVRAFTQDDAHVFCRVNQIKQELGSIWDHIIEPFYRTFGFHLALRLSLRDPKNPKQYLGTPALWHQAEQILRELAEERKIPFIAGIGEAAFYGPKLDFLTTDSLGRQWQVATIQLDMNQPERFDLYCIDEQGQHERIVMIHAAIMGSIERFLSILIEHTAGAFPVWLAPVQTAVIPIAQSHQAYANQAAQALSAAGIRCELKYENQTLGKRIRETETQKIPYLLIVGDKEVQANAVSVRKRGKGDAGQMPLRQFIEQLKSEITHKK